LARGRGTKFGDVVGVAVEGYPYRLVYCAVTPFVCRCVESGDLAHINVMLWPVI
jgi:hypothetical protein